MINNNISPVLKNIKLGIIAIGSIAIPVLFMFQAEKFSSKRNEIIVLKDSVNKLNYEIKYQRGIESFKDDFYKKWNDSLRIVINQQQIKIKESEQSELKEIKNLLQENKENISTLSNSFYLKEKESYRDQIMELKTIKNEYVKLQKEIDKKDKINLYDNYKEKLDNLTKEIKQYNLLTDSLIKTIRPYDLRVTDSLIKRIKPYDLLVIDSLIKEINSIDLQLKDSLDKKGFFDRFYKIK
jgi:hypothetical protein